MRSFHGYILRMFGLQADTAENGEAAFEKLLRDEYHLLVTDINASVDPGRGSAESILKMSILQNYSSMSAKNALTGLRKK